MFSLNALLNLTQLSLGLNLTKPCLQQVPQTAVINPVATNTRQRIYKAPGFDTIELLSDTM